MVLRAFDPSAVDPDIVGILVSLRTELADGFSVDRDAPFRDQLFGRAPRGDPRRSNNFLKANSHQVIVPAAGCGPQARASIESRVTGPKPGCREQAAYFRCGPTNRVHTLYPSGDMCWPSETKYSGLGLPSGASMSGHTLM